MTRWAKSIVALSVAIGALWIANVQFSAQSRSFRIIDIEPMVFVENKLSGEQIRHLAYQARVQAYADSVIPAMDAYARQLFSDRLRDMAEHDGKTQIWITFFMERVVIGGENRMKTFRAIFVHDAAGWRRVEPAHQQKVAAT